jgi:hypothetical protein
VPLGINPNVEDQSVRYLPKVTAPTEPQELMISDEIAF